MKINLIEHSLSPISSLGEDDKEHGKEKCLATILFYFIFIFNSVWWLFACTGERENNQRTKMSFRKVKRGHMGCCRTWTKGMMDGVHLREGPTPKTSFVLAHTPWCIPPSKLESWSTRMAFPPTASLLCVGGESLI